MILNYSLMSDTKTIASILRSLKGSKKKKKTRACKYNGPKDFSSSMQVLKSVGFIDDKNLEGWVLMKPQVFKN